GVETPDVNDWTDLSGTVNDWTHSCSPVADAGDDQIACPGTLVTLDGRASHDPNDDPLTFTWSQLDGRHVTLTGGDTSTPTFLAALPPGSTLTFLLTVKDFYGISYPLEPGGQSSDTVTVTVGVPGQGSPVFPNCGR